MRVFMAGAAAFGQSQARTVVVSMSSARPLASFASTFAVAGAISTRSARSATETWATLRSKLRSKVSTSARFPVSCSKVRGVTNSVAWAVMITCTSAWCLTSMEASAAAL